MENIIYNELRYRGFNVAPLLSINDSFKKMIIVGDNIKRKIDENGIITIGLLDFLLDESSV